MGAAAPVQSPFLPDTKVQFAWDSTSLGLLKTCPRLYQYIMLDGWSKKDESVHLRFGQELHQALQDYAIARAKGIDHETALVQVIHELLARTADFAPDETTRAGKYKNRNALIRTAILYLDKYKDDAASTLILDNGKPAVELSFRFELDFGPATGSPYLLSGHLDRVVTFQDSLFVMDHKTTTSTPGDYYFNQFEPNNQMSLYTLASQIILGSPVKGVIINAIQILVADNEFKRGFTYRTPDQLEEWMTDLERWLALAESYAEANYWPMNDTACDKFGGCQFRGICSKSPHVREKFLSSEFTKLPEDERWNPLKPR